MGDSAYIKNAMLLNALGESKEQNINTQGNISLNHQSSELILQQETQGNTSELDM